MNQNNLERTFRKWNEGKRRFSSMKDTSAKFSLFCKELLDNDINFDQTLMHTGFWLPENWEIPFRLPALILPALEIMQSLLNEWITPPRFIIYQATTVIASVNHININDAYGISDIMKENLSSFVDANFPELNQYITFKFWEQLDDLDTVKNICRYAEDISSLIDKTTQAHFEASGKRHGSGEVEHFYYVTANNYYNGAYEEYPFPEFWNPEVIIPIWWRSETLFFETLLNTQLSCRDIFPLITQLWAYPTYYMDPRWDIENDFRDISHYAFWHTKLHPDTKKDIQALSSYHL